VLSGGEIVAAALTDAAIRRLGGVLGNRESLLGESFSGEALVGPPVYTRPAQWDGEAVPGVLLSGNHAQIRVWREREMRERGRARETGEGST
jgi:tRNA (guanine37-N1)-methyltransferase